MIEPRLLAIMLETGISDEDKCAVRFSTTIKSPGLTNVSNAAVNFDGPVALGRSMVTTKRCETDYFGPKMTNLFFWS